MLKVLIVSCDFKMDGGVASLVKMISEKFTKNVEAHHFFIGKNLDSRKLFGRFSKTIIDAINLFKTIRHNNYDVIHINPSLDVKSVLRDGLFMLIINMSKTPKSLVFFHGWDEKVADFILDSKILCFLMRITYGKAEKIIILAGKFAKPLVEMGIDKDRLVVFPTMFDGSIFEGVEKKQNKNQLILLFMSRFVTAKGMIELLEAFYKLPMYQPPIILHLVGDGPEKTAVEKKIIELGLQEKVKLPGYIKGKEKAKALLNADVFVFPSYYREGCPIALLEAMAAGLPLITTTVGGIPDIVIDGKNGVLLTSHTPDAIKEGIEKMLENKNKLREIGKFNKKTAWENYEANIVTSKLEQIYQQVAGVNSI